jgi:hypothetical protein
MLMDEQLSHAWTPRHWLRRDWPWLLALLIIVGSLRAWLVYNTEVTARDSIGFIRYALRFDSMTWGEALKDQHQHPGYPAAVWAVSQPMRMWFGATPETMRVSAQLVSVAASILLAIVMFRLGKHLWDRYVGFFAALLFQCLPISGHHLSDGISDGLFLLFVLTALLLTIRAWEIGSPLRYAMAGAMIGVSYLTRPEGLLLLPAIVTFHIAMQAAKATRKPFLRTSFGVGLLIVTCAVAGSPYFLVTKAITIKPTAHQILHEAQAGPTETGGWPLFAATFTPSPHVTTQLHRTLRALILEMGQALNYIGGFVGVWALIACRKSLTRHAGFYLLAIYFSFHAAVLIKLGLTVSYVSDRHVMALVSLACYPVVIGMAHLCSLALRWRYVETEPTRGFIIPKRVQTLCAVGLCLSLAICAGKTVTRLHGNRAGNHAAGLWLANNVHFGDHVDDDHNWSHFYSGMIFVEGDKTPLPADAEPRTFEVITRSKDEAVKGVRENREEGLRKRNAAVVYHWPTHADAANARIVVYQMPRNFATNPWAKEATSPPGVSGRPVSLQR